MTSIGDSAFEYCRSLTSVTIPDSVKSIGNYAFRGCSSLTSVTIPDSVTSIGYEAFYNTAWYDNQPDGLMYVGKVAYKYKGTMPSNTSIIIKDGTISITGTAFYDCSGLTSITIPNSVTSIGDSAFYNCSGLTSVTIPDSVTSIGDSAFSGCYRLIEVYNKSTLSITAGSSDNGYVAYYAKNVYTNEGGSKLTTDENGCVIYTDVDEKILVAYHGTNTELILPSDITKVYNYAFSGCSSLTSVTIPNSVTSIGGYAFDGCSSLTRVTIGNSVTSIGDYAFRGCSSLTSVTIPDSVTSIGYGAFYNTAWYDNQPDGLVYAGKVAYKYKGTMPYNASITIIEGTLGIASSAFSNGKNLTSITIPNSVTNIGSNAFYKCTGLMSVTIPDGVTSIGSSAFKGCTVLRSVTIGNSVTNIGFTAFYNCKKLASISVLPTIPPTLGSNVFANISAFAEFTVPKGTLDAYKAAKSWSAYASKMVEAAN